VVAESLPGVVAVDDDERPRVNETVEVGEGGCGNCAVAAAAEEEVGGEVMDGVGDGGEGDVGKAEEPDAGMAEVGGGVFGPMDLGVAGQRVEDQGMGKDSQGRVVADD
jgi:hypothetical protein